MASIRADNPIENEGNDLLGRASAARAFADDVLALDASEGLVVGVLGAWGWGKTSSKEGTARYGQPFDLAQHRSHLGVAIVKAMSNRRWLQQRHSAPGRCTCATAHRRDGRATWSCRRHRVSRQRTRRHRRRGNR